AKRDGHAVNIRIEQEPGAAGAALADRYVREILRGYAVKPVRVTGTKETRATPVAAAAEHGLLKLVDGRNAREFLDEVTAFPHAPHDDCVDALAGAFHQLSHRPPSRMRISVPRRRIDYPRTDECYQHSPYPYAATTLPPRHRRRHLNGALGPISTTSTDNKTPA
ncbi:MAG TPA: hypothetical protein VLK53_07815, partial [Gaiellaceae bacterium]|nr:hypothetical protein [Gaiellaceae bacterium]